MFRVQCCSVIYLIVDFKCFGFFLCSGSCDHVGVDVDCIHVKCFVLG